LEKGYAVRMICLGDVLSIGLVLCCIIIGNINHYIQNVPYIELATRAQTVNMTTSPIIFTKVHATALFPPEIALLVFLTNSFHVIFQNFNVAMLLLPIYVVTHRSKRP
jgi:hypothetical protein